MYKYGSTNNSPVRSSNKPAYMENRQFFKDITSPPVTFDKPSIDKETIMQSVYGEHWKQ